MSPSGYARPARQQLQVYTHTDIHRISKLVIIQICVNIIKVIDIRKTRVHVRSNRTFQYPKHTLCIAVLFSPGKVKLRIFDCNFYLSACRGTRCCSVNCLHFQTHKCMHCGLHAVRLHSWSVLPQEFAIFFFFVVDISQMTTDWVTLRLCWGGGHEAHGLLFEQSDYG